MRKLSALLLVVAVATGCDSPFGLLEPRLTGPPPQGRQTWTLPPHAEERILRGVTYQFEVSLGDGADLGPVKSLSADLKGLPSGSDASFQPLSTPDPDRIRRALFRWTPRSEDRGFFRVVFIGQLGSTVDRKEVWYYTAAQGVDLAPVLSAPDTVWVAVGDTVTFTVSALDSNDEPVPNWELGSRDPNAPFYFEYAYLPHERRSLDPFRTIRVSVFKEGMPEVRLEVGAWNSLGASATVHVIVGKSPG